MKPEDVGARAEELLENVCEFVLGITPCGLELLPESDEHELIAGDGRGGCFYLWHAQRRDGGTPVVYVSSCGEASRFAETFDDALAIAAAFPSYWCDVLVATHKGGDLPERVILDAEADMNPDYAAAREELRDLLSLDTMNAPARLAAAVAAEPPFRPELYTAEGPGPSDSFGNRSYPD